MLYDPPYSRGNNGEKAENHITGKVDSNIFITCFFIIFRLSRGPLSTTIQMTTLRAMLYLLTPSETYYQRVEDVPNYLATVRVVIDTRQT